MSRRQEGFTLVELMVVMALFAVVSVGFYQVMFSGSRSSDVTRSVVRISEEARLGFNRMIRDTREATGINLATSTSYSIDIDYDRSGNITPTPGTNSTGDFEQLVFTYNATARTVTLNGELLMAGVIPVSGKPVFSYTSNQLRYDTSGDGVTDEAEINAAVGNSNGQLDLPAERALVTGVVFAMQVEVDDRVTPFYSETQLRNKRSAGA